MECAQLFFCFAFLIGSIGASLKPRIIGGNDAEIETFPYQASLRVGSALYCGGTIIGQRHILTAAHCFTSNLHELIIPPYTVVKVHTGTTSSAESGHVHSIDEVTFHPEWSYELQVNDIAVVKLADEIVFDDKQQKADLPNHDVISGTRAYLTGWGFTTFGNDASSAVQLQKIKMIILNNSDCPLILNLSENEFCAFTSWGHGCCYGDSGGPLTVDNQVVGILSWVLDGDCAKGVPETYTNVYAHKNFIESAMNK